jgi:DUF2075 family protein
MQLYTGSSKQFIDDTVQNRITEKLKDSFFRHFRFNPPQGEVNAWRNSLSKLCNVIQYASLMDQGIAVEYQLPLSSKRLDCMMTGHSKSNDPSAVIVELKQWEAASATDVEDCVITFVGGAQREVLHPSRQVGNYQEYLQDCHTVFSSGGVRLASCGYLHNMQYDPQGEIFSSRHAEILRKYPVYAGDQATELAEFLGGYVGGGNGQEVLSTVLKSKFRAGKKLLEHTSAVIKREKAYVLLDEQQVVFNSVLAKSKSSFHEKCKVVVLIEGGAGSGKSVIALNLLAELAEQGYNVHHATGSRAFTENIRKVVGRRASVLFKYFNNYDKAETNAIDVLIMDEAHRIRPNSFSMYTPKASRTERSQIEELVDASKVSVFFIDDLQVVRPNEVGSSSLIRETAMKFQANLYEFELDSQFRCNGSDGFVNWIDNTLDIRRTANVLWSRSDPFDFTIFDSVRDLERAIRKKAAEGYTARMMAGFCWPWSNATEEGGLVSDVEIGGWAMPWNARPESTRLAKGIPKSHYWASDPNGINQVGCVYTAQGFEFDYAGIIFGLDLRYDPKTASWVGDKNQSHDSVVKRSGDKFMDLVKQTYRVLLTRGLKGCYVYFMDENTRNFFRSRME